MRTRRFSVGWPIVCVVVSFCALAVALLVFSGPALATVGETPPPEPGPVNTSAPTVTGTPVVGQTLSCSQGGWANNPDGYTYTWFRDGSPIAGQISGKFCDL